MDYIKSLKLDQLFSSLCKDQKCIDNIIFTIGPLTALIAAKCGMRTWLKYEIVTTLLFAAVQFFKPELFLGIFLSSPLDSYHRFLCKMDSAYLIYTILLPIFLWKSKDESVFFGHFWAQLIAHTFIIIENVFWWTDSIHWTYKLLCTSASYSGVCALICIYFIANCKRTRGFDHFDQDKANYIAKIESFMIFTAGLVMYASPQKAMIGLSNPNHVHLSLCRLCGILLFTRSFESFCVSDYVWIRDKKNFMASRLIGSLGEMAIVLLGFYQYKVIGQTAFCVYMTVNMGYNSLVLYGYLVTPAEIRVKNVKKSN